LCKRRQPDLRVKREALRKRFGGGFRIERKVIERQKRP